MITHAQSAHLTLYQQEPLNAGTPLEILGRAFLTPNEAFFIRSHGTLPLVERASYRLLVTGLVERPLELSLADLLARFEPRTETATLICAGHRRDELAALRPLPGEILWGADPVSTARWRGVRLRDVLQAAGVTAEARYVAFRGLDEARAEGKLLPFGSSISLEKALSPEVLLAYAMNDAPLPREHGFPLRVLIPGYIGARSVKWLQEITLQSQPSNNYFQARDYKTFPPDISAENVDWRQGQTLERIALNSVICSPRAGETRQAGRFNVHGYALTGQDAPIARVEITSNGGANWTPASITASAGQYAWYHWSATLTLPAGEYQISVRAHDSAGRTQPEHPQSIWNFKGYSNNSWHHVHLRVG